MQKINAVISLFMICILGGVGIAMIIYAVVFAFDIGAPDYILLAGIGTVLAVIAIILSIITQAIENYQKK